MARIVHDFPPANPTPRQWAMWRRRQAAFERAPRRRCERCNREFRKPLNLSIGQWRTRKLCSATCLGAENHDRLLGRNLKADLVELRSALERSFADAGVPYGMCQCGCGEPTAVAKQSSSRWGIVNGEPVRFRKGHAGRALTRKQTLGRARQMVTAGTADVHPQIITV